MACGCRGHLPAASLNPPGSSQCHCLERSVCTRVYGPWRLSAPSRVGGGAVFLSGLRPGREDSVLTSNPSCLAFLAWADVAQETWFWCPLCYFLYSTSMIVTEQGWLAGGRVWLESIWRRGGEGRVVTKESLPQEPHPGAGRFVFCTQPRRSCSRLVCGSKWYRVTPAGQRCSVRLAEAVPAGVP